MSDGKCMTCGKAFLKSNIVSINVSEERQKQLKKDLELVKRKKRKRKDNNIVEIKKMTIDNVNIKN